MPSCTFKMALAVLCLVDMTQNVFLYNTGLSPLANPEPFPLLNCFLRHLLFTSCSLMGTFRAQLKVSWESQDPMYFVCVRFALLPGRDAWAFWLLFPGGWVSCLFPSLPCPGAQVFLKMDALEVWPQTSWLLLYMKIQYIWHLTSNQ